MIESSRLPPLPPLLPQVVQLHGDGELSDDDEGDIEYGEHGGWLPTGGMGARAAFGPGGEDPKLRSERVRQRCDVCRWR